MHFLSSSKHNLFDFNKVKFLACIYEFGDVWSVSANRVKSEKLAEKEALFE